MNKTLKILEAISETSGTNLKIELLGKLKNDEFAKFYFETALSPMLTYGVGKVKPLPEKYPIPRLDSLLDLRKRLNSRKITGDKARLEVAMTVSTEDPLVNRWLKGMWEKKLRIGVSEISINKVFPKLIPTFELEACEEIDQTDILDSNWIIQPKYDGLRCVLIFEGGQFFGAVSRNGKEMFNIDHIGQEVQKVVKEGVLDGEIYGEDWNESLSVVKSSKTSKTSKTLKFYVFDFLSLEEWRSKQGSRTLEKRLDILQRLFPKDTSSVSLVPNVKVRNTAEAWDKAKAYLKEGYEGAVAKNLNSLYIFDRTRDWLKLKFVITKDLPIVDFKEGEGKYVGMLGAFVCKLPNGTLVDVGGGYKDVQRVEFWKHRKSMIGKIIEVKAQEITKDGSMRFPVFKRVREDK
jgi:ATP-dependent DNA ligase